MNEVVSGVAGACQATTGPTINQITAELERHPVAIASRVANHLNYPLAARCNGTQLNIGID